MEALESFRVAKVACGGYHTLALTTDNELFAFGANNQGECGTGNSTDLNVPKQIEMPSRRKKQDPFFNGFDDGPKPATNDLAKPQIRAIACGGKHSLILAVDGSLYSFGCGQQGQLGHRSNKNVNRPKLVEDFGNKKVKLIAAGLNHSIACT